MEEANEIFCNQTIYCYLEEQKDGLEAFIAEHDSDSFIHIFASVIESCEGNLFYCLGDIINNYIENPDKKIWFVTDIKSLFGIVKKLYSFLFERIIYIEQENKQEFDEKFDIDELTSYFLDIQKSRLNALFMKNLLKLKDSAVLEDYTKFLYELDKIEIDKEGETAKMWCCFCAFLMYGINADNQNKDYFYFKLTLYSIIMQLSKDASYTNAFIDTVNSYNSINEENLYFVWSQFQRISLKNMAVFDEKTDEMLNEMYDRCYNNLADGLKECLVKIPHEERDKNLVMIFTMQFLNTTHAPTKTIIERAMALSRAGKRVVIVNTCEHYIVRGYLPMYQTGYGRVLKEYNDVQTVKMGNFNMQFLQLSEEYPIQYRIQILANFIKKLKPFYILSVGTGSILADLCGNIVPCASMTLTLSSLAKTKSKLRILERELYPEEEKFFADNDIIKNEFKFELKKQQKKFTRQEMNLPEDKFILVVVGMCLKSEVSTAFAEMLEKTCLNGCYVVFAGIVDNYNELMKKYPTIDENSSFIGYCDDILALMEICDLYVNPDRMGGGFSVIEAFSKRVPGVYLNKGDVCAAGGEDFAVNDFNEMEKQIIKYKEDKEYYNNMAKLAKKRANIMTSPDGAIVDIDRQICQKIEEKYW